MEQKKSFEVETIIKALGGIRNILMVTSNETNLSLKLENDSLVNVSYFNEIEGIAYQFYLNQHQITLEEELCHDIYMSLDNQVNSSKGSKKKKIPLQNVTQNLADIFITILPALVATGLLMGLRELVIEGMQLDLTPELLTISKILTDTAFTFIPVLVCFSAMKKFGGTPVIGIVLGLMLVSPELPNKWDVTLANVDPLILNLFGMRMTLTGFQSSILPALF